MSKRDVVIQPYSLGDMTSEVIRAYLHTGNPSALLGRIIAGVEEYQIEHDTASPDDQRLMQELLAKLDTLRTEQLAQEEETYKVG